MRLLPSNMNILFHTAARIESTQQKVWVYQRCLFCNNGMADVKMIFKANSTPLHLLNTLLKGNMTFQGKFGFNELIFTERFLPLLERLVILMINTNYR